MIYREYPIPVTARVAAFCAWRFSLEAGDGELVEHQVPPDGTTNLLVVLGPDGSPMNRVVGPSLAARHIPVMRGWSYAGLRLRPEAAAAVIGRTPAVESNELCPPEGPLVPVFADLADLAADGRNWPARRLDSAFRGMPAADPALAAAVDRLVASGGLAPLAALADLAGLGPRQFRRRFRAATGVSPSQYAAVQRLRRAIVLALDKPAWAQVAIEAGYADQPHLARALKARFGTSAGRVAGYLGGIRHELLEAAEVRFVQDREAASG